MVVLWKKNDISFILKVDCIKLLGIAQHSETLEEMVVYQALYGKHEIWVRPKTMFFDKVVRNGIKMDRFKEITEKEIYAYYPELKDLKDLTWED